MRIIALLAFFIPILTIAQVKYAPQSKKLYDKALKEYKAGKTDEALNLFEQCVTIEPRYAEAYLNISLIQYSKKQMGDALKNARNAYNNNKNESAIYDQLGKCYYQAVMYDSAAFCLDKGIEMGQTSEMTFIYAGKSSYQMDDSEKAIEYFNKAITINGSNPVSFNSRGKVYFNTAEYDKAEADFKKAIELNPQSAGLYANLANTLIANNKNEDALTQIEKGMTTASDEEKIQLMILWGNYYHNREDYEKAIETFEEAYALDNTNALILNNQAAVYLDQDKFEQAVQKLDEALDLQPELMEAYFNRGIANEMLRKVEDACSDWEQAFILGSEKAEEYLNSPTCNE
jgi:tetratricopeptide (TPR) repeat protein